MASSSIEICKMALSHLGDTGKDVTNLDTPASSYDTVCARFYSMALDIALTDIKPKFAIQKSILSLYNEDDDDGPLNGEWVFAYAVPARMLHLMKILPEGAVKSRPSEDFDIISWLPDPSTPTSTDTSGETVTFTEDPGWAEGTPVSPISSAGGLVAGTTYYIHRVSATEISFHTTLAAALADTSRVNLTSSIAVSIVPTTPAQAIVTNTEDAYADYVIRVTTTTSFTQYFTLALSYLLASLLIGPVVKGKAIVVMKPDMMKSYEFYKNRAIATDGNQEQISERYRDYVPAFLADR